jgi:hypothetical protein
LNTASDGDDPREALFAKLAAELGGEFENEEGWRFDRVRVEHHGWDLTLEFRAHAGYRCESIYTRFRSPVPETGFRFRLFEQTLLTNVARLVGLQDIATGDEAFDRTFVVQGNDEDRTLRLFSDARLRELLVDEPEAEAALSVIAANPPGLELSLEVPGRVEDGARLRRLYDAFVHLLANLRAG